MTPLNEKPSSKASGKKELLRTSPIENYFQTILESIGDGITVVDNEGIILLVNPVFEKLLGWTSEESLGNNVSHVVVIADDKGHRLSDAERPLALAFSSGKQVSGTYYLARKDGTTFPATVTANPIIFNGEITGAVDVIHDVTKEKQLELAKNEFISVASYQLRNPLAIIGRYLKSLGPAKGKWGAFMQEKYLHEIKRAHQGMMEIADDLLRVSRIELKTLTMNARPISISKILKGVLQEMMPQIMAKNITIERHGGLDDQTLINIDPNFMMIILSNLLSNAIHYSPPQRKVTINLRKTETEVIVEISDEGYGIPQKDRGKVFTKFFRAENAIIREPYGSGLGLYITKSLVDLARGRIWFESEEHKGTSFFVALPVKKPVISKRRREA